MITDTEKLILFNQYEILKFLNPDETDSYEQNQKVLEYGSESDIEELSSFLIGTSEEVKKETFDILQMFRDLEDAYEKFFNSTSEYKYSAKFRGFDGNEEPEYYCYCKHLIIDEDRYSEFKGRELNSHFPVINRYRKMLNCYNITNEKRIGNFYENPMTLKEFEYIIQGESTEEQ